MKNNPLKILFVDDDTMLGSIVTLALNRLGYDTHFQSSLTAIEAVIADLMPNIIILDVEIGEGNGIDAARDIRNKFPETPIIFVSSHIQTDFIVRAIDNGGAVYIKKPFEIEELIVYINRHAATSSNNEITLGNFALDCGKHILKHQSNDIAQLLNNKEFALLRMLAQHRGNVVSRGDILTEIWGDDYGSEQSLNNYIARIRQYLATDKSVEIITVNRVGYKLMSQPV